MLVVVAMQKVSERLAAVRSNSSIVLKQDVLGVQHSDVKGKFQPWQALLCLLYGEKAAGRRACFVPCVPKPEAIAVSIGYSVRGPHFSPSSYRSVS